MLGETGDGTAFFILIAVVGLLGECVVHLTERMLALRSSIRYWALGLGIGTGICFLFLLVASASTVTPESLLRDIFSATLAGLCGCLTWYFVVAVVTFAFRYVIAAPLQWVWSLLKLPLEWRANRNRRQEQQLEGEGVAKRQAELAAEQTANKKRKADSRAACEVLYLQYVHLLADRLTMETFQDFMTRHMGDEHSPEYVEMRGRELQDLILHHAFEIKPLEESSSLESLSKWYQETKLVIANLPIEDRYKQAQFAHLNARYAELMQELVGSLRP